MPDKERSTKSRSSDSDKQAITVRLDQDLYRLVHALAGERQESFNDAIHFIIDDWWRRKDDRSRYESFIKTSLRRR